MPDKQHAAEDDAGANGAGGNQASRAASSGDYAWFDTGQAAQHYPELERLTGWTWWWAGTGAAAQLIGYRYSAERGVDLVYIDADKRAALTRANRHNELYLHERGELAEVLAHVPATEDA